MNKLKNKQNFEKFFLRKFVFHKTKQKSEQFAILIGTLLNINDSRRMVTILCLGSLSKKEWKNTIFQGF